MEGSHPSLIAGFVEATCISSTSGGAEAVDKLCPVHDRVQSMQQCQIYLKFRQSNCTTKSSQIISISHMARSSAERGTTKILERS